MAAARCWSAACLLPSRLPREAKLHSIPVSILVPRRAANDGAEHSGHVSNARCAPQQVRHLLLLGFQLRHILQALQAAAAAGAKVLQRGVGRAAAAVGSACRHTEAWRTPACSRAWYPMLVCMHAGACRLLPMISKCGRQATVAHRAHGRCRCRVWAQRLQLGSLGKGPLALHHPCRQALAREGAVDKQDKAVGQAADALQFTSC